MGLYDDRLADLSEPRKRDAGRSPFARGPRGPSHPSRPPPLTVTRRAKSPTNVQSLLFERAAGWSESKAKAWAKSQGYSYGKVDVTDQYVRIRQFDPKGSVKRTVPFGRGIRAVVAREDMRRMATAKEARRKKRRRPAKAKKAARKRPRRKRVRAAAAAVAAPRRKRRRARAAAAVAAPRRKRRRRARAAMVMEAPRKRRRKSRRKSRRVRVAREAWKGNSAGHATAARKGWKRKKKRGGSRRRRRAREATPHVMQASRRRRRSSGRRVRASNGGLGMGGLALMIGMGGFGFLLADGVDRLLATYNPSSTDEKPKDKFTSDGAGTLANTLNIASMPNWMRLAAGGGLTLAPAVGSRYVRNPLLRASLEGAALGAGISTLKTLWNNVVMPLLLPKETDTKTLQESYIARLYPAEAAAHINKSKTPPQTAVSSSGSGALSDAGVGDVGPFALQGDSPYPDAGQALRTATGVHGDSPYPSAAQALRTATGVHDSSPYPDAAQALRRAAGVGYEPGPPPGSGPGPKADPHADPSCNCLGDPFLGFAALGDEPEKDTLFTVQ